MGRPEYREIAADDVRPGDVYKFISTADLFFFGEVVEVFDGLVKVRWWERSEGESWTYKRVQVGRVVFARPSPSTPLPEGEGR